MDSSAILSSTSSSNTQASFNLYTASLQQGNYSADLLVLNATFGESSGDAASVSINFQDLYKGLSVTSKQIVDKINDLLKAKLPNGVQSLTPADVTPEATSDRIVQGATAFFDTYAKQHPELEGEDLLTSFMKQIRSGIETGYNDAFSTLKGLGAFDLDGIQAGVEKTKELIGTKLQAFEELKRKELGLASSTADPTANAAQVANTEVLKQAGGGVLAVRA